MNKILEYVLFLMFVAVMVTVGSFFQGCAEQKGLIINVHLLEKKPTPVPTVDVSPTIAVTYDPDTEQSYTLYHVKKHDTLWGIAKKRYQDPFLWPAIYQENRAVIQDPHWIYPKQVFRCPVHIGDDEGKAARDDAENYKDGWK